VSELIITLPLELEQDVVVCRQRAGQIAGLLGLDRQDQTRTATAVSEIARNAFTYAGSGFATFALERAENNTWLLITVTDEGPGIAHLDRILAGAYRSATGMGLGIVGSRRLMDRLDIQTGPGEGTRVTLAKRIPPGGDVATTAAQVAAELLRRQPPDAFHEVRRQNRELLEALDALRSRHKQVARLNEELRETNRGIVALYGELEDRAEETRRSDEDRTRFFSSVGHELRTPINSVVALARLMLTGRDDLSVEHARQAEFILSAGEDLSRLVDDLLDLARSRAGKVEVHVTPVDLAELLGTLRGMLRPLATREEVELVVEDADGLPVVHTDGAKLAQILRNLVTNALKFTEHGEVRVRAMLDPGGATVTMTVADTGIGIDPTDQRRVFEELTQLAGPLQAKVRGSGLGLAVSRDLASVLGGQLVLDSIPGVGSTFSVTVPIAPAVPNEHGSATVAGRDTQRFAKALVIDDDARFRYVLAQLLKPLVPSVVEASGVREGILAVTGHQPDVVFVDLVMPDGRGEEMLARLRHDGHLTDASVFICTSLDLDASRRRALEREVTAVISKDGSLAERVLALVGPSPGGVA
jgi:signal transduction histidine kinase